MARNIPTSNSGLAATNWDFGEISIRQDGTGAANLIFRISAIYGKESSDLDPMLDPSLNIHLFDKYHSNGARLLLEAKFGDFITGLTIAKTNGKNITQDAINSFIDKGINLWTLAGMHTSMIAVAIEAIELATIAEDELSSLGIVLYWPTKVIYKE